MSHQVRTQVNSLLILLGLENLKKKDIPDHNLSPQNLKFQTYRKCLYFFELWYATPCIFVFMVCVAEFKQVATFSFLFFHDSGRQSYIFQLLWSTNKGLLHCIHGRNAMIMVMLICLLIL